MKGTKSSAVTEMLISANRATPASREQCSLSHNTPSISNSTPRTALACTSLLLVSSSDETLVSSLVLLLLAIPPSCSGEPDAAAAAAAATTRGSGLFFHLHSLDTLCSSLPLLRSFFFVLFCFFSALIRRLRVGREELADAIADVQQMQQRVRSVARIDAMAMARRRRCCCCFFFFFATTSSCKFTSKPKCLLTISCCSQQEAQILFTASSNHSAISFAAASFLPPSRRGSSVQPCDRRRIRSAKVLASSASLTTR